MPLLGPDRVPLQSLAAPSPLTSPLLRYLPTLQSPTWTLVTSLFTAVALLLQHVLLPGVVHRHTAPSAPRPAAMVLAGRGLVRTCVLSAHDAELTYELTLKSSKNGQSDDCEQQEDFAPIEAQIRERELQNAALRKELRHKEALITALEGSMRRRERLFLEELKRRSHRMAVLNSELQKQSETAAHLSFQLHSVKQRLINSRQGNRPSDKPSDKAIPTSPVYTSISLKRNHKVHSKMADLICVDRAVGTDSARQRRVAGWEELDPMPDPALFLQARWQHGQRQSQATALAAPVVSQGCRLESGDRLAAASPTPRTVPVASSKSSNVLAPPAETEIPLTDEENTAGDDSQKGREGFRK